MHAFIGLGVALVAICAIIDVLWPRIQGPQVDGQVIGYVVRNAKGQVRTVRINREG